MRHPPEDELPSGLEEALAALPCECEPSRLLEERTVRALRAQGVLSSPARIRFPASWMAGAAAACVALFAGGVAVGQHLALRSQRDLLEQVASANARQAALVVQQTGTAYVQAIAQLQQAADTLSPAQRQQSREVAVQAFRAAANELVRLAPDDPVAAQVLIGFERAQSAQSDTVSRKPEMVWF